MNLRDGVVGVRNALGEGKPWLFDNNDIIRDLNRSARSLTSAGQVLRGTYAGVASLDPQAGSGVYHQEYQLPADVEFPYEGRVKIGVVLPLIFKPQAQLQIGGYVAANPFAAYLRRGILLTQQAPTDTIIVEAPPQRDGTSTWILGFWPVPSSAVQFWVDYVQYHPWMYQPLDPLLLPDTAEIDRAWKAFAIARGKEKEGDLQGAQYYDQIHTAGKEWISNYMLAAQTAVTAPIYDSGSIEVQSPFVGIMQPTAANLNIDS